MKIIKKPVKLLRSKAVQMQCLLGPKAMISNKLHVKDRQFLFYLLDCINETHKLILEASETEDCKAFKKMIPSVLASMMICRCSLFGLRVVFNPIAAFIYTTLN